MPFYRGVDMGCFFCQKLRMYFENEGQGECSFHQSFLVHISVFMCVFLFTDVEVGVAASCVVLEYCVCADLPRSAGG